MHSWHLYITTNKPWWTLYIWVTSDLIRRISEHKQTIDEKSFTAKYNCKKLVYYENYDNIETAIKREKQLKNWHRDWKIKLIETMNPNWDDLYEQITQ